MQQNLLKLLPGREDLS